MNTLRSLLILALATAGLSHAQENFALWSKHRTFTLNTTNASGGANVNGNTFGVPVLVRLGAGQADVFSKALAGGADIRFTKADGVTPLSYQIEEWNAAGTSARVWVRLDTVYANANQSFRMYWGRAGAADSSSGPNTFRSAAGAAGGYQGVWHFENNLNDATSNAYNGTNTNTKDTAGIHGRARYFNGTDASIALGAAANMVTGNGVSFSIEAWVNWRTIGIDPATSKYRTVMNRGTSSSGGDQLFLYARNPSTAGVDNPYYSFGYYTGSATNDARDSGIAGDANQWVHLTATYSGSNWRIYTNGYLTATTSKTGTVATSTSNWFIGSYGGTDRWFHGALDEIRFSTVQRDSNFVRVSYATQRADNTALTLAASVNANPVSLSYALDPALYTVGVTITPNTPSLAGGADSFTVAPALPAGLSLDKTTGAITGSPSAAVAATGYVITAVGPTATVKDTVTITVSATPPPAPTLAYAPATLSFTTNVAITAVTPTLGGGAVDSIVAAPSLPAGLTLNKTTGVISGTPTAVTASMAYAFTARNAGGTARDTITIAVNPPAPTNLVYPVQSATYLAGVAISPNAPSVTGSVDSFTVAPALPAGLTLNKTSGAISGTPGAAAAATNHVITARNAGGFALDTVNITVSAAENYNGWTKHRAVRLNTTAAGANVFGSVTGFPVLLRLDSVALPGVKPGKYGQDLRFTKRDNTTLLAHQIDTWDTVTRAGTVWVLVDTVYGNNATQAFHVHWGATAPDVSRPAAVFDTARGFQAVWHFSAADTARDATSNGFSAVPQRTATTVGFPGDVAGPIGRGREFGIDATSNAMGGYYAVPNSAAGRLDFAQNSAFTISAWAYTDTIGVSSTLFSKSDKQYSMELRQTGAEWEFSEFQGGSGWQAVNDVAAAKTWTHLVGVRAGALEYLYVNGVLVDSEIRLDASTATRRQVDFNIGRSPDGGTSNAPRYYFNGRLDEIRLANRARDLHWIRLEYENQKTAQTLVSYSDSGVSAVAAARRAPAMGAVSAKALGQGLVFNIGGSADGARLVLVDMWGRTVWKGVFATGTRALTWDGRSATGALAAPGLYLARVEWLDAQGRAVGARDLKIPFTR